MKFFSVFTSRMSATVDENIGSRMGTRDLEEFADHLISDAACPEALDAVAFQLLCMQRRCRTARFPDAAKRWKTARLKAEAEALAARARLAANPSRESHPGFFDDRGPTRPGILYHEMRLPFAFRGDFGGKTVYTGCYSPPLVDGELYRIGGCRDLKAHLHPVEGGAIAVDLRTLDGLGRLGRLEAVSLGTWHDARNAAARRCHARQAA